LESVTDAARVLLTAAVLSGIGLGVFVARLSRADVEPHERLVGQLRLAQAMALVLAATGAVYIGFALAARTVPAAGLDVALAITFVIVAGVTMHREPRESLIALAAAFVVHAIVDVCHRPGLLGSDLVPHWYPLACALYVLYAAALCQWAARR
jgi:uncharacterized membrane protein HdeD (DUF308 family)